MAVVSIKAQEVREADARANFAVDPRTNPLGMVAQHEGEEGSAMFDVIPVNGETWLVCGGRDFANLAMFESAMGDLVRAMGLPARIIHGGARGADTMAGSYAKRHAVELKVYEADWRKHRKAAGPIRNQHMIDAGKPHLV